MIAIRRYAIPVLLALLLLLPTDSQGAGVNLTLTVGALPACEDGIDNDGDMLIDFPTDTDCTSVTDTNEGVHSSGGGGGGGGGSGTGSTTGNATVLFSGRAYPGSTVTLLQDARIIGTTIASSDATFSMRAEKISAGSRLFSLYAEDSKGNRSSLITFPLSVSANLTTTVSGVFIPPTIGLSATSVKQGDPITILGQTAPGSAVTISVGSAQMHYFNTLANTGGTYAYTFTTQDLEEGQHTAQSRSSLAGAVTGLSKAASFSVGNVASLLNTHIPGDVNGDNRVNIVDFSIVAYWFGKTNPPANVDLNADGKVNLVDFSIMAYNWTG